MHCDRLCSASRVATMLRTIALVALASCASARRYSDDEYRRLGGILYAAAASSAASSRRAAVNANGDATSAGAGDHVARWAGHVTSTLDGVMEARLAALLEDTYTEECREKVANAFIDTYKRALSEDYLPFEQTGYTSDCDKKAPASGAAPLPADEIRLCYLLIVHESPEQIARLIEALEEGDRHNFVIHVDDKPASEDTFLALKAYAKKKKHVRVMETGRTSVSWGGFNVVQATLNGMELILDELEGQFDWISTLSGYTYPLASNRQIRETLAQYPRDSEFVEVRPTPNDPQPRAWHQFVECDDRMRRIWRLQTPKRVSMYMGSQWMTVTARFAAYAVGRNEWAGGRVPGTRRRTFAADYRNYAQYTMVADENFFTTVIKNAPVCGNHVNQNFLHVQFDQWENEKEGGASRNKCLQPNPRHCGRSPTTLTLDYLPVLELGKSLFARKFDVKKDAAALDAIDGKRRAMDEAGYTAPDAQFFHGVRIARRERNGVESCVTLGSGVDARTKELTKAVSLRVCDANNPLQRFNLGPCSSDGHINLRESGPAAVTPGLHAPAPFCPVSSSGGRKDGAGAMMCLDLKGEHITPGTPVIAYPCSGRWNQLFGLGTGAKGKPDVGSLFINIPYAGHPVSELCLDAPSPTNGDGVGVEVTAEACDGSDAQTFAVQGVPKAS